MNATERRTRLAIVILFAGLLVTIGLSLGIYLRARQDLNEQVETQTRLQAATLQAEVSERVGRIDSAELRRTLAVHGIQGAARVYLNGNEVIAASTLTGEVPQALLGADRHSVQGKLNPSIQDIKVRQVGAYYVAEAPIAAGLVVLARPANANPVPAVFYMLSYQAAGLVLGLAIVFLLVRRFLRPYRRMIEAARGSPIRASSAASESEFVVETFQALISQLQAKERELAELHSIERRRAEKSERFSERLVASIPSGLVVVSPAGMVTSTNHHARQIFGELATGARVRTSELSLDHSRIDFRLFFKYAPRMVDLVSRCLQDSLSFKREEVDVSLPDGRTRHLGLSVSPIADQNHDIEGALCLITDITEVTELRDRMKVQENLANLGEMAAGLAHEFKNSLATIQGYVQLLEAQSAQLNGNAGKRVATAVIDEVGVLTQLVTDFLNFARPQQPNLIETNIRNVLEECAGEINSQIQASGINFSISGEFASLPADEGMLRRAFSNLLRNAVEAIDHAAATKSISVTGSLDGGDGLRYAHIRISDTGTGVSPENVSRIFIPFYTTKSRGYGIGLALVQKVFIAHGGSVAVEKSDSSGTIFHCRLPMSLFDPLWRNAPTA